MKNNNPEQMALEGLFQDILVTYVKYLKTFEYDGVGLVKQMQDQLRSILKHNLIRSIERFNEKLKEKEQPCTT